jgi:uncharacterized protein
MQSEQPSVLQNIFTAESDLEFAVLIGSRAWGAVTANSDWDIALQWRKNMDWLEQLGRTETLRRNLSEVLACPETAIDLIDTPRANLAMRLKMGKNRGTPLFPHVRQKDGSLLLYHSPDFY